MNKTTLIILLSLAILFGSIKAILDHVVLQTMETSIGRLAPVAWVTYQHAGLSLPINLSVSGLNIAPHAWPPVQIEKATIYGIPEFALQAPLPSSAHVLLSNIHAELPWPRIAPEWVSLFDYTDWFLSDRELAALGFQALRGDLEVQMTRDEETDRTAIQVNLDDSNFGVVELNAVLTNLPPPPWTQGTWLRVRLAELALIYTDPSFIEKSTAFLARRNGLPHSELQKAMAQRLQSDLQVVLPRAAASELGVFIETPRQLTITIKPTQPIAIANLRRLPVRQWALAIKGS
ncbi:MAG: hypothetical protein AAF512_20875 [Pseudomonadota bacterium]